MAKPASPSRPQPAGLSPATPGLGAAVLWVHLALSPLVFTTCTLEAFEFPKTSLLLLAAVVLGALRLSSLVRHVAPMTVPNRWCWLRGRAALLRRDILGLGFLAFLTSATLSTATSLCPRVSLWGAHESYAGLGTIAA